MYSSKIFSFTISAIARSKTFVGESSFYVTAGSNPTGDKNICHLLLLFLLLHVVRERSFRQADLSSREVLQCMWACACVRVCGVCLYAISSAPNNCRHIQQVGRKRSKEEHSFPASHYRSCFCKQINCKTVSQFSHQKRR